MDWSNLKADYERLGSYSAVATAYGVSKGYVAQEAKRQGINPKPEGRSLAIDWSGLPALYQGGMTYDQLAAHYQCSVHAIQNAMKRLDVTPRPTGLPEGYEWTEERRIAHRAATSTPEFAAKSRENLLKRLPSMRGPSANSPLEKLLQAALLKVGISFSTQRVLLGRYCVDILVQQAPVILEADGSLHHLRKMQDSQRDADLTAAGYRVFRFTGSQINQGADVCTASVIEACGLVPDTDPVADIRTGMMGPENPNWRGGPVTVTCEQCGEQTTRNAARLAQKKRFCDSKCYGTWLREHPEASNRRLKMDFTDLPALCATGMSVPGLATHFGCSTNTIIRVRAQMGVPRRKSRAAAAPPDRSDSDTVRAVQ